MVELSILLNISTVVWDACSASAQQFNVVSLRSSLIIMVKLGILQNLSTVVWNAFEMLRKL